MSSRNLIGSLIQRVQQGSTPAGFVHLPHARWPLPRIPEHPIPRAIRIAVLDSSFNCPTKAHLALAASHLPNAFKDGSPEDGDGEEDYTARLLLLSVRNADKKLKPTDATYIQRIEMMKLLASDIEATASGVEDGTQSGYGANVAIAIIDEPTFVGKSRVLRSVIQKRLESGDILAGPQTQLFFLLGMDTLERLISPRYYPPSEGSDMTEEETMRVALCRFLSASPSDDGDGSRIVCANRLMSESAPSVQVGDLEAAREFLESTPPRIVMMDIGEEERKYSSSAVRDMIGRGDEGWREMVTVSIAEYITREGLYVRTDVS